MKLTVVLVLVAMLSITLVAGCGGEESNPTPTPTPVSTPAVTASPTASPQATPAPTPAPSAFIEAWIALYKGPMGGADWVFDIAVDDAGNVYVTGKSYGGQPYDYSYATIKYDNDGNELWVARYDGPGGDDDVGHAIAVGSSGNVYVTGKSYNSLHEDYAYATIKYNSAGEQLWVARYDGSGTGDDIATALAIDGSGNVYVTGSSGGDYATLKYDRAGKQLWEARYDGAEDSEDGAVSIGLDSLGNVYVTGTSRDDIATIKYDNDGNELWVSRLDVLLREDAAKAMVVDDAGNVYVTGKTFSATKYEYEFATVKFDTGGKVIWSVGCYGPDCVSGEPADIAVDNSGNVYVTGRSYTSHLHTYGYATVKYDSDGNQRWVARYDDTAQAKGEPFAIAVDKSGNIYVVGDSYSGVARDYACVTIKYAGDGNEMWVAYYEGSGDSWDQGIALAVDDTGNVYVTGKSDGGVSNRDYVTIKYVSRDSAP